MPGPRLAGSRAASAVVVSLVVAAGAADRPATAEQTVVRPVSLMRASPLAAPRSAPALDPWERRSRVVSLNAGALPARATSSPAPAEGGPIVIDLFEGAAITAVFDRFDPNDTGVTWVGHVPAHPGSLVTIVRGGGLFAASIMLPDTSYTIRPVPRDASDPASGAEPVHLLVEIDSDRFLPEAPPVVPEITPQALGAADVQPAADTAEFIDVLFVYTALAENWASSRDGIVNWINLGMSETNSAYAASGVHQRVRLVHAERVAYAEVSNFSTNLNILRGGGTGLDAVPALRNAYTADLVSLFVQVPNPSACGIAFIMTSVSSAFAPSGYNVVQAACSSPGGTLAHEFGHNMGLRHDWYMDAGVTPFTYAHGYVNLDVRFRTIMAYPDACASRGFACTRLLAFSNPEMTHLGQPMGVAGGTSTSCPTQNALNMSCDADERRALNNTALVVANFREFSTLRPPLIVAHPQSQSAPPGQAVTLQVAAEGAGPFTYQWYRGTAPGATQPIPGATAAVFTVVPGSDGVWLERWSYWARVSNAVGPANSSTAIITMTRPGAAADAPQRRSVDREATRPRERGAPGAAKPRAPLGPPAVGLWQSVLMTCHAARMATELARTAQPERGGDVSEMAAAWEQLMLALAVLQAPACRTSSGGHW
jgi:hypothetical protein